MVSGGARSRSGPPRKPTALKVLQGNPGKRPLNTLEPQPEEASLKPPKWLDAEGRKVWRELAPIAHRHGLLTVADVEYFAHACAKMATARREQGTASKAFDQADRILARFGFTPSDRAKISVKPMDKDPFGDWLKAK